MKEPSTESERFMFKMVKLSAGILFALLLCQTAFAEKYNCQVTRKLDAVQQYPDSYIADAQFSNILEETPEGVFVSRCSFIPEEGKVGCNRYRMDKVTFDENISAKKYYHYASQFDFQLFANRTFVENNGRATVSYGKCELVAE